MSVNAQITPAGGANPMDSSPLVSVLLPAYNGGDYLQPAIDSVLNQTYRNLELIIVDDGSTDGSIGRIDLDADPRMRLIRQRNMGKPAALNRALELVRGEFYALQDADDLSHPTRFEKQVACLRANPAVAGVFCGHDLVYNGAFVAPTFAAKSPAECRDDVARALMPAHDPTAMYRMSMVGDFRYAEDLPIVEGFDFVLRVGEQLPLMVLGEVLYSYRIHSASVTKRNPRRRNELILEARSRMRQRRGLPPERMVDPDEWHGNEIIDADNDIVSSFVRSVMDQVIAGRRIGAIRTAWFSITLQPFIPYYYKPMVGAAVPAFLLKAYRRRKQTAPSGRHETVRAAEPMKSAK